MRSYKSTDERETRRSKDCGNGAEGVFRGLRGVREKEEGSAQERGATWGSIKLV